MKLTRATSSLAVDYIKDYLQEEKDFSSEEIQQFITLGLKSDLENFLLLIAHDDSIKGFVLAHKNQACVSIIQLWTLENSEELEDLLFFKTIQWAQLSELPEVRIEQSKAPHGLFHRWGLSPLFVTMSFAVRDDIELTVVQGAAGRLKERSQNQNGNSNNVVVDEEPTENLKPISESDKLKSRSEPEVLHATNGVPTDSEPNRRRGNSTGDPDSNRLHTTDGGKGDNPSSVEGNASGSGSVEELRSIGYSTSSPTVDRVKLKPGSSDRDK